MELSRKQRQFLELMEDPEITELFIGGSAGGSTVFGHPVQTPYGEKLIEDVEIGDIICNSEGEASVVVDTPWEGDMECYKVTFVDGSSTEVSKNHLWKYKRASFPSCKGKEFRIGRTKDLIAEMEKYNLLVPLTKPVVFRRDFCLGYEIDPYVLGVLLGDGSIGYRREGKKDIHLRICCSDKGIIDRCRERVSGEIHYTGKRGRDWELVYCKEERGAVEELGLVGKKCNEKFIPDRFKFGSVEERKEILQGLFDTDGWVDSRGHLQYSTTSLRLAEDVQYVVRSLGGNATISSEDKRGEIEIGGRIVNRNFVNYLVYIQHEHKEWFLSLPRKLERIRPYNGGRGHLCKRILKIESVGVKHSRCITTSAEDGLYLTDDFVVTHNSKSYSIGLIATLWAIKYPGIRFFIGRKTLKSLKQSTIATLLGKVFPALGVKAGDYHMGWQSMELTFRNGSIIIFGELENKPSDPVFSRVGSLEIDVAIIDEAGEVSKMAKDAIKSRTGRGVMAKYGMPGKLLLASNPDLGWLKDEYYTPYEKLGASGLEKWEIGKIELDGVKLPTYRAFLRMGAYDNPFLPQSYIDNLKTLPSILRKRLLAGDWNYADDENSLFRSGLLDKAITYENPVSGEKFDKFVGCDLADKGKDKSVFSLIVNGVLVTQKVSSVQMNWDSESELPMSRLVADELVEFAMQNGFTQRFAKHIAVECNGIGAACLPPGENITTTEGIKPIEHINKNDVLYGKDGDEVKITHLLNYQYSGKIYTITPYGFTRGTKFTNEHPIWASQSKPSSRGKLQELKHDFRWYRADKVHSGMWIKERNVYQQERPLPDMSAYDFCKKPNRYSDKGERVYMNAVINDAEFWWVVGYWLGDGWLQNVDSKGEIHFCYNRGQLEFRDRIEAWAKNIYRKPTRYHKPDVENTVIRCHMLAQFFNDAFGQKAYGKHLPEWVKFMPAQYKVALLQGYFDSDGSNGNYTSKGQTVYKVGWSSCNIQLLEDVKCILDSMELSSGIVQSVRRSGFRPGSLKFDLRLGWAASVKLYGLFEKDCKLVAPEGSPKLENRRQYCYFESGWIYRQIKDVDVSEYTGKVYNFSTSNETFMAGRIPTHNCRDMLKERGWMLTEYIATHKSRSEGYYQMMLDMDSGALKIKNDLIGLDELRRQLSSHTYEMTEQTPSVVKKEKIKQTIGHSPDEADSLMIANWVRNWISNPQNDPRRNKNRLLY